MARKSSNGHPSETEAPSVPSVEAALEDALDTVYRPTGTQRAAKAAYWVRASEDPTLDPTKATASQISKLTGDTRIYAWFKTPGFKEWFLNREEHRARLEYLFGLALDAAEDIILSTDPKAASARVNMIKAVSELAGKYPRQQSMGQFLDGAIQKMDRVQLQAFLEKNGVQLALQASAGHGQPASQPAITIEESEPSSDSSDLS